MKKQQPHSMQTPSKFVEHLPDLITAEDYLDPSGIKKIRIRINTTDDGVDLLGDSMYTPLLEKFMAELGVDEIERMLCG